MRRSTFESLPQDMKPLPEPVEGTPPPKKIPPNEKKEPAPDDAAPAAPSGPTIQLGAYASTIKADTAWGMLSGRFPEVAALKKTVVTATVKGKPILPAPGGRLLRADQSGLCRTSGGGRKLPGRQLMQAAIYGLAGTELSVGRGRFLP